MIVHCCEFMDECLSDARIQIFYEPISREYYIPLIGSQAVQCIIYCPFCGKKLPSDLRNRLYEILENEYDIEPEFDFKKTKGLPKEFLTDEWWKKRGL